MEERGNGGFLSLKLKAKTKIVLLRASIHFCGGNTFLGRQYTLRGQYTLRASILFAGSIHFTKKAAPDLLGAA